MKQKTCWMLYDQADLAINRDFVHWMQQLAIPMGMEVCAVCTEDLTIGMDEQGHPFCLQKGVSTRPDFVLSRQRDTLYPLHFEHMGIPVYNGSRVCELCNDKRKTHQFLQGLPMPYSVFLTASSMVELPPIPFPFVLKPAKSHGGDRIFRIDSLQLWQEKIKLILPEEAICQSVASDEGKDLRVYVLFGKIVAGVMRTAKHGLVSNYKQGGGVCLHTLSSQEIALANEVIKRFDQEKAPLMFAGIDFLYHNGKPLIGEVEDVVGSRMLYETSDLDIAKMLLQKCFSC